MNIIYIYAYLMCVFDFQCSKSFSIFILDSPGGKALKRGLQIPSHVFAFSLSSCSDPYIFCNSEMAQGAGGVGGPGRAYIGR